jgi:23S rRNA (cytosine1962-C5)-methyltransferase
VSTDEFYGAVREVLHGAGRRAEEFLTEGHPQDHAATFREAEYLKAIYWRLLG